MIVINMECVLLVMDIIIVFVNIHIPQNHVINVFNLM